DVLTSATYHREFVTDPEKMEYFVPVEWAQTLPLDKAVNEIGLFRNQNTVCAPKTPKWRHTIERLKEALPAYERVKPRDGGRRSPRLSHSRIQSAQRRFRHAMEDVQQRLEH